MWLFGLISLIEMQLLRIIRDYYPDDSWKHKISENGRLKKAEDLFEKRRQRNEAIDLADCLQFCDKRDIVLKSDELCRLLGFDSTATCEQLKSLEDLRNELAHSQDIITGNRPRIVDLVGQAEDILRKCEKGNATH